MIYALESINKDWLADLNGAIFALVEEFVDQVLRAKNVKDEWMIFYQEFQKEIWQSDLAPFSERLRIHAELEKAIETVLDVIQSEKS